MYKKKMKCLLALVCIATLIITNSIVWVPNVEASTTSTEQYDTEEPTFTEITFSDFNDVKGSGPIADGTYGYNDESFAITGYLTDGFANKTFVGTVNFTEKNMTAICFAGKDGWGCVQLNTSAAGQLSFKDRYKIFDTVKIDANELKAKNVPLGQNVEIRLSIEVTNLDDDGLDDDVRFWLYFGDELYKGGPIQEAIDYAENLGKHLGIYSSHAESSVTIASKVAPPQEPTFTEITFSDFNDVKGSGPIADGTYGYNNETFAITGYLADGFANKTFVGTVNFTEKNMTAICFAGKDGWGCVQLNTSAAGQLSFKDRYKIFDTVKIDANELKAKNVPLGQNVEIRLSIEVTNLDDDGLDDDVRFWLYFGDELYKGGPIQEVIDYAENLGKHLGIYSSHAESSVTIASKVKQPPEPEEPAPEEPAPEEPTFPEITFNSFSSTAASGTISDGTYGFNNEKFAITGYLKDGFANKTFVGTVNFTDKHTTTICFAGKDGWGGVWLYTSATGKLSFKDNHKTFATIPIDTSELKAENVPLDRNVEIRLLIEVTNLDNDGLDDDVRFWLYFGDELYKGRPIQEAIDYAQYLGQYLGIYSSQEGSSVTIASKATPPEPEKPVPEEPSLPEITFDSFSSSAASGTISDGTYGFKNEKLAITGYLAGGLANKTFVGTVNFTDKHTTTICFAGKDGWGGVWLYTSATGKLSFKDNHKTFATIPIDTSELKAENVPLGQNVEIRLSIEVTNLDDDGLDDDVRFWLYFGDELYKGRPIQEAIDYAQYLGQYLGIYSSQEGSSVTIASKKRPAVKVDFSIMGFTEEWEATLSSTGNTSNIMGTNRAPYTGDHANIGVNFMAVVLAVVALGGLLYIRKRDKLS